MNDLFGRALGPLPRSARLRPLALAGLGLLCAAAGWAADVGAAAGVPADALPRFDIYQFVVEGNSTLSPLAIEAAVTPHMGEQKTLKDVEAARVALEKAYHDAGYLTVVVAIPDQSVDTGEVSLRVVEAVIGRLKVKGAEYALPSAIKSGVPEVAEGMVPNFNTLQAQLAAVNRSADARITPVLRAGKLPGTVEVQLDVDDQLPLHGSIELNNRQTPNTTAARVAANLRYDNLFQRGHSLGLTLQTAPQRTSDARVAALSYLLPGVLGQDAFSIYAVHSRSVFASLANAPGLGLLGNSDTLGLRYSLPLESVSTRTQSLSLGLDYKHVQQTITLQDGGATDSPISYVPMVASYSGSLIGEDSSTTLDLGLTAGLRGLLGNSDARFHAKRPNASAQYLALRVGLQHIETVARWSLTARADSQVATGPLVPTEQMVAGGAESVRGYLEGERAGDMGLRVTLELRTPGWAPAGASSPWRLTGLAFVDAARLKTLQVLAPQQAVHSLAGAGMGLRLSAPSGLSLELDGARALVRGELTAARSNRIHARALWAY